MKESKNCGNCLHTFKNNIWGIMCGVNNEEINTRILKSDCGYLDSS